MPNITSTIQVDKSGVDLGSIAININGSAPHPAQHFPLYPYGNAALLEMRAVLVSGNAGTFVNNVASWTSCDALPTTLFSASATRVDSIAGTTGEAHIVTVTVRRKLWHADQVNSTMELRNNAVVDFNALANQTDWDTFNTTANTIPGSTGMAAIRMRFLPTGVLEVRKSEVVSNGGGSFINTENFTWNAGIPPADLEIRVVPVNATESGFSTDLLNWTAGTIGGDAELGITSIYNEGDFQSQHFDVEIRYVAQPANYGVTRVRLNVGVTG